MRSRVRVAVVFSVVVIAVLAFGWPGPSVVAQTPEKVNFALDWIVYGKHAMYYPALEQGIY